MMTVDESNWVITWVEPEVSVFQSCPPSTDLPTDNGGNTGWSIAGLVKKWRLFVQAAVCLDHCGSQNVVRAL